MTISFASSQRVPPADAGTRQRARVVLESETPVWAPGWLIALPFLACGAALLLMTQVVGLAFPTAMLAAWAIAATIAAFLALGLAVGLARRLAAVEVLVTPVRDNPV